MLVTTRVSLAVKATHHAHAHTHTTHAQTHINYIRRNYTNFYQINGRRRKQGSADTIRHRKLLSDNCIWNNTRAKRKKTRCSLRVNIWGERMLGPSSWWNCSSRQMVCYLLNTFRLWERRVSVRSSCRDARKNTAICRSYRVAFT